MPELPEVEIIVRTLRPRAINARITSADLLRADIVEPPGTDLAQLLTGHRVIAIDRRGKRIVVTLEPAGQLVIHLGMTGRLTLHPIAAPRRPHTHLVLQLTSASSRHARFEIHFSDPRRFGGIRWLAKGEAPDAGLGPEPLTITPTTLAQTLSHTRRPIKSALLDQRLIAGLGNIYVDESLFRAGIHPLTPANTLSPDQIQAVRSAVISTLRQAINHRGSTLRDYVDAAGGKGSFQKLHNVYGKSSQPCPKCRSTIQRLVLSGRSTCYCPRCQPATAETRP
jgi:formamidopyrimidine-DNA glycosylase